ncbi:quinolinate synthase NadA [Edaphobacter paludis]|uniref:quinolinate synthase n=1 Tax=Edaphobacter paludis TaxID=3035702 RepID=A0AAU7DDK7_9BACT
MIILGHFYQRDEIVRHADFLGDNFQLAHAAKSRPEAGYIVFCGVHFMAQTAAVLSGPDQKVILPNLAAGCSMADIADIDSIWDCWEDLTAFLDYEAGGKQRVLPVTYMNSAAGIEILKDACWHVLNADVVVMASGGAGQVFLHTTNPRCATGDGFAMAFRAGAENCGCGVLPIPSNRTCGGVNVPLFRGSAW